MTTEFLRSIYKSQQIPVRETARARGVTIVWPESMSILNEILRRKLASTAIDVFPGEPLANSLARATSIMEKISHAYGNSGYDIATRQLAAHTDEELITRAKFSPEDLKLANAALTELRARG